MSSNTKYCVSLALKLGNLLEGTHIGLNRIIKKFQKEQNNVMAECERILRGEPAPQKTAIVSKEKRNAIFRNCTKDLPRAIAHNISL